MAADGAVVLRPQRRHPQQLRCPSAAPSPGALPAGPHVGERRPARGGARGGGGCAVAWQPPVPRGSHPHVLPHRCRRSQFSRVSVPAGVWYGPFCAGSWVLTGMRWPAGGEGARAGLDGPLLGWRAGFVHTAFTFSHECAIARNRAFAKSKVPPGALITVLQKGLQLARIEAHLDEVRSRPACACPRACPRAPPVARCYSFCVCSLVRRRVGGMCTGEAVRRVWWRVASPRAGRCRRARRSVAPCRTHC